MRYWASLLNAALDLMSLRDPLRYQTPLPLKKPKDLVLHLPRTLTTLGGRHWYCEQSMRASRQPRMAWRRQLYARRRDAPLVRMLLARVSREMHL